MVAADQLMRSWQLATAHGDQLPLRFYAHLFVTHPETRDLFPLSMAAQRDRLVGALGHIVSRVADIDALLPFVQQLGRDHRKFGVNPEHYAPVGQALVATLGELLGDKWTPQLEKDWTAAYELVARLMTEAASEAEAYSPPWWDAQVERHERRTLDIAVLTLRPEPTYTFLPGQSAAVETTLRPQLWRFYSPANAPRDDGTIELHVRRTPGGQVSSALVDTVRPGDVLRLGAPVGHRLTLPRGRDRDLVLLAGGTGLAPLKAIVEQVVVERATGGPARTVTLMVGVRTERDLYDLANLQQFDRAHSWLTVAPAVDADPFDPGAGQPMAELALTIADDGEHEIFVCGPDPMVRDHVQRLRSAGYPEEQVLFEGLAGLGGNVLGVQDMVSDVGEGS